LLTRIVELLESEKVFVRRRKTNEARVLGILLIYLGLSCRSRGMLQCFADKGYEAARQWYRRAKYLFESPEKKFILSWCLAFVAIYNLTRA